jgi:hypothetical protein
LRFGLCARPEYPHLRFGLLLWIACSVAACGTQRHSPDPRAAVSPPAETERLYALLSQNELPKARIDAGFDDFSDAAKLAVVQRVARQFEPPPPGRLLARLKFIRTAGAERWLRLAYDVNLRSPDAAARRFALLGLQDLGDDAARRTALAALRDDDPEVLATALTVLFAAGEDEEELRPLLAGLSKKLGQDERFHASRALLAAHGF